MQRRRANSRSAFTLAELIMSLAVSSLVLAAAASLAYAVSHAWTKSENIQTVVNHGRNGVARIGARIRGAKAVGYVNSTYLLIWREDADEDGRISMAELTLYTVDARNRAIYEGQLVFSSDLTQAARDAVDTVLSASELSSPSTINALARSDYFRQGAVAEYVDSVTWVLDADPPDTTMVEMELNLSKDGLTQTLHAGMSLRNREGL